MNSAASNQPGQQVAPKGLPPVAPPSGRFIAQLFLVPGLIVVLAVLLLMAFSYTLSSGSAPEKYLEQLDSANADIRWRGASDLAQVLKRAEAVQLKCNVSFALDLAQRLRKALDELKAEEKKTQQAILALSSEAEKKAAWFKLQALRDQVMFLSASLGDFYVAIGVPLLCEIILDETGPEIKSSTQRRRQALWALANLGQNVQEARKLSPEQRSAIANALHNELSSQGERRDWAQCGSFHLERQTDHSQKNVVQVDLVLATAAKAQDRFLREQVAVALNFWDGPLVEPTLLLLSRDNGQGTLLRIEDNDEMTRR